MIQQCKRIQLYKTIISYNNVNALHIMKELIGFDILYDKLDCTNATQHCNNWEPGSYCKIKELHWKAIFGVLRHSSHFQICHRREDKIQWSEPNCATDGHKVPKKGHGRSNQSNKSHVNGSENKSNKVFAQGETASSFAGQHFFLKIGICWPAIYLKGKIRLKEALNS